MLILDCGERPDETEHLWACADVFCCACGGHAGDEESMRRVVAFCARSVARLGAHVSYPDRAGFGRRSPFSHPDIVETVQALADSLVDQERALLRMAHAQGVAVTAVKPHGALYHDAAIYPDVAGAVIDAAVAVFGPRTLLIGPRYGFLHDECARQGIPYAREGFADRRMRPDGSLVPRDEPGALILDPEEAAAQAKRLLETYDVVCVHGDTPGALAIARAVRAAIGSG